MTYKLIETRDMDDMVEALGRSDSEGWSLVGPVQITYLGKGYRIYLATMSRPIPLAAHLDEVVSVSSRDLASAYYSK